MSNARAWPALSSALRSASWQSQADGLRWRVVDLDDPVLQSGFAVLDQSEQARADRFRFDRDRDRYIAAHVSVRLSLSELLGQAPNDIAFVFGEHGKPDLGPRCDWVFNLSHSDAVGLIACAPREQYGAIGVDVETIKDIDDLELLARDNFTEDEREALVKSRDCDALRLFLRCWTRKEACLKALGTGLTLPANTFTAGLTADLEKILIDVERRSYEVHVKSLFETEECLAAISWCHDSTAQCSESAKMIASVSQSIQEVTSWT